MGLYKITETFHSDRPVWRNTATPHRYLLYNGKLVSFRGEFLCKCECSGKCAEWVISEEVSDAGSIVKSKERGLTSLPETGWQYYLAGWQDDPTLAVTPQQLVWSDEFEFLDETKWSHLVTTHPPEDFQYYRNNRANSWVSSGQLHLMPSLTAREYGERFLYRGRLDLAREDPASPCNIHYSRGELCEDKAGADIVKPIQLARLETKVGTNLSLHTS